MILSNRHQRGFAAVEMVLVTPVLLFFLVLVLELGNILIQYNIISKSVQNGARYAVSEVYDTKGGTIAPTLEIQNMVVYGKNSVGTAILPTLSTSDVTVAPPSGDSYVRVSVAYNYVPNFLSIPFSTESFSIPLSVTAVMRVL
ncbi:Pilus assembly protein TadE [Vibrio crassostreae]|nr:Pilus assembly protein TadE [Vibrio crassostreae]CAK3443848.1 Pilus assembly protein TadE [Vibrio crassostreae]CAK3490183.1 Pilus assembly protein TadE [Vibrio crassostreae]CAK3503386.1 Pilus assembly protein TadE [Vibrio crassostreae]CAK3525962.1 Pilus assembly protein TadE [Vibrio crassostreae]